jgi:hypothetical protein
MARRAVPGSRPTRPRSPRSCAGTSGGPVFRLAVSILGRNSRRMPKTWRGCAVAACPSCAPLRFGARQMFSSWVYRFTFKNTSALKRQARVRRYRAPHVSDQALAAVDDAGSRPL